MEDEIVKKIAELLGSETGIETEKVYNHIQEGLKKREAEKLKKELSEKTKEIEDKKRAQKDDVKTKEETKNQLIDAITDTGAKGVDYQRLEKYGFVLIVSKITR